MSLQDIRVKLETGLNDIYTALEEKSAAIPEQKNLLNVAPAIRSITGGGGDNSGEYVWSKYSDYTKGEEIPYNTKLLMHLNDNLEDESGINTPKLYGTAQYDTGKFDKAFKGDGASCIAIPNNESIKFGTKDFTISCWYYWDGSHVSGEWACLLSQRYRYNSSYTESGFQIFLNASSHQLIWKVMKSYSTDVINTTTTDSIPVNEWFHLAMVRKGTSLMLFLNGKIISRATISASDPVYQHENSELKFVGATTSSTQDNTAVNRFICKLDEIIVVNGTALWDSNFTPPTLPYGDTGTFEEYVVSDNENAYPNNDYGEDGYYYIKEIGGQEPQQPQVHNYLMLYDGTLGEAGEAGANVCADVTGGYKLARTDGGSYWTLLPINYNADNLFLNSDNRGNDGDGIHYYSSFITKNPIELSDYEKIGVITYMDYSESLANIRIKIYGGDSTSTETLLTIFDSSTSSGSEKGKKSCFVSDVSDLTSGHLGAFANEEGVNYSLLKMYGAFICKQDDYQPILDLAGITTTYTDEASICASQTAMTTILNNKEAIDYMVHNCTGTFMLAFLQSETALNSLNSSPYKVLVYQNDVWIKFLSMVA